MELQIWINTGAGNVLFPDGFNVFVPLEDI